MTATVFTEAVHPMAPLIAAFHDLSIDQATIAQSQTIVVGQVLGSVGVVTSMTATVGSVINAVGSTGDGTLTMDGTAPIRSDAIDGIYKVEFITGASATAAFNLIDPLGVIQGEGQVGTTFNGVLKFAIADDASHHYNVGDVIPITIRRDYDGSSEQLKAWDPAATDGSAVAIAVALYPVTTGSGQTARIAVAHRECTLRSADLTWKSGATAAQIAEGTVQLANRNIILR